MPYHYFAIAPIEGLHLTCDFSIHSTALYGSPPNYSPTPVGLHEAYRQPYEMLGTIPFSRYAEGKDYFNLDDLTLQTLAQVETGCLKDFTCMAFELELDKPTYASWSSTDNNNTLFERLHNHAEQIIDLLRLYLFTPGENNSIGSACALGYGVSGIWLCLMDGDIKFIARKTTKCQVLQNSMEASLEDVRKIYNDGAFKELRSAACQEYSELSPFWKEIFTSLRAFRESRDLQSWEARIRHLATIAESLAKRDENERLHGRELRERIAKIAAYQLHGFSWDTWNAWHDIEEGLAIVNDLWSNLRNPITHSLSTALSLNRDPVQDMIQMEKIVIAMIHAIISAWVLSDLAERDIYEILLEES